MGKAAVWAQRYERAIVRVAGIRILESEFSTLVKSICGLRRRGGVWQAFTETPGHCETLLGFLALKYLQRRPIAAGFRHTCAIQADGELICFGDDQVGQCNIPLDLGVVVAAAAGGLHRCAVKANGTLVCFGNTRDGLCDVPDLGPVHGVAATADQTVAHED